MDLAILMANLVQTDIGLSGNKIKKIGKIELIVRKYLMLQIK